MNNLSRHSFHFATLIALILLVPVRVQADVTEAWVQRYSNMVNNSVDRAFKVLSDPAGDIIVTGTKRQWHHGAGHSYNKIFRQRRFCGLAEALQWLSQRVRLH